MAADGRGLNGADTIERVRIDLHTHSAVSDGTDAPDELIRQAAEAGLDVVALTDHDTVAGWDVAAAAAQEHGIELVPGIEISTRLDGVGVHLLAYWPDPTDAVLADELQEIRGDRADRIQRIVTALVAHDVPISVDDVLAEAGSAVALGRPHVADALVRKGIAVDRSDAFVQWLAEGKPGYLPKHAPGLSAAIALVRNAGGVPVLAHPWGRSSRGVLTPAVIERLATVGLAGLEVDHEDHDEPTRAQLRGIARELNLAVTGSSDHHGTGKADHPLGRNTTEPEQLDRLRAQARPRAG